MKLHIDNGNGDGLVDYTPALLVSGPLTVRRKRGELATCSAGLHVSASHLPVPVDRARVRVTNDAGAMLFTGYISGPPRQFVPGQAVSFTAAEDAWLLHPPDSNTLQPAGSALHMVDPAEHTVKLEETGTSALAMNVADVAVFGGMEAAAYVTELFRGDGTTAAFQLTDAPFREAGTAVLLADSFEDESFNFKVWQQTNAGGYLGIGSSGLRIAGGNGLDGQTVLRSAGLFEMGGTLTAELAEVRLKAGSDGVLLGMYSNPVTMPNCFAGFRVKGSAGARTVVAMVNGAERGTAFTFTEGHRYTLRLRLHCAQVQRVPATYQALVNGDVQSFGRGGGAALVEAPMQLVFEIQDLGLASSTVATVLYAGSVATSPAQCVFAPVNSIDLMCDAGACSVRQQGSAWVVSNPPDGTQVPRREGAAESGADFSLNGSTLLFYPGRVPAAGEQVTVTYRRARRSRARVQDQDALAVMTNLGLPGLSSWAGSVQSPTPRSSADCRYAAQALLAFGADPATGVAGEYTLVTSGSTEDIRPGDRLSLPLRGSIAVSIPVEAVTLVDGNAAPEVMTCTVRFAQDRETGLSFGVSDVVPQDVPSTVPISDATVQESLSGLQVVSVSDTALQMDAGRDAPNGGGFEVRRRDGGFGSGDADLVLQSPVRSFSVPRTEFQERFYVRMYDGSLPPAYSEWSSVVVTHLPVS